MRRSTGIVLATTAVAVAVAATYVATNVASARDDERARATPAAKVATTKIVRTTLSDYYTETGTVGYRGQHVLRGTGAGVITWLPRSGAVLSRGGQLYRADDRPVTLLYGSTPLFRDLATVGTVGRDVRVLATNLTKLGYDIGDQPEPGSEVTVEAPAPHPSYRVVVARRDGVYTKALRRAVKRWQTHLGIAPADGVVHAGDALVQPGALRIGALSAAVGDDAAAALMTVSDRQKVVDVPVDADRADDVRTGQRVTLTLPDSTTTSGTVRSVDTAVRSDDAQDSGGADQQPKVHVTVTVDRAAALERITSADVTVRLTGTSRTNVLAVAVGALLALSGGGYGVQIEGGPLVAVRVGLFADGMVEISGPGLAPGTAVVTTS